jgi:hypothetical protein
MAFLHALRTRIALTAHFLGLGYFRASAGRLTTGRRLTTCPTQPPYPRRFFFHHRHTSHPAIRTAPATVASTA